MSTPRPGVLTTAEMFTVSEVLSSTEWNSVVLSRRTFFNQRKFRN